MFELFCDIQTCIFSCFPFFKTLNLGSVNTFFFFFSVATKFRKDAVVLQG